MEIETIVKICLGVLILVIIGVVCFSYGVYFGTANLCPTYRLETIPATILP